MIAIRRAWIGAVLMALLVPAASAQPVVKDALAAADPIVGQLEAIRRGDWEAAYGFASEQIRKQFDRQGFERMVRGGYPEIASSTFYSVSQTRAEADGLVYVRVKIRGDNGKSIEALYEVVREASGWKINGVVTKADAGLI